MLNLKNVRIEATISGITPTDDFDRLWRIIIEENAAVGVVDLAVFGVPAASISLAGGSITKATREDQPDGTSTISFVADRPVPE